MEFEMNDALGTGLELDQIEETGGLAAVADQDTESWDFWDSEYWIVRDRPPYRV